MQTRKLFQVLWVAVLCSAMFVAASFALDREDPKGNPAGPKVTHQVMLHRATGKTVGHWNTMKSFTAPSPLEGANDCGGWCNDSVCVCSEDWWDEGCCEDGCSLCWAILDQIM
jgi:hypothetical protein